MLEAPFTSHQTIPVSIVGNTIQCGERGGNLRLKSKTGAGNPLRVTWTWDSAPARPFRLQFFAVPLEGDTDEETPFWPFNELPEPDGGLTQPLVEHIYTLKNINIVCKYSVYVGSLHLDPIIIVEK